MIWGAMSSAGVGPLCFLKTNVTAPVYQEILEHFMLPSDFIFQQDLAPAHTAKRTKSWLNYHDVGVLDWPANSPVGVDRLSAWPIISADIKHFYDYQYRPFSKQNFFFNANKHTIYRWYLFIGE